MTAPLTGPVPPEVKGIVMAAVFAASIITTLHMFVDPGRPPDPVVMNEHFRGISCRELKEGVQNIRGRMKIFERDNIIPDPIFANLEGAFIELHKKWCVPRT